MIRLLKLIINKVIGDINLPKWFIEILILLVIGINVYRDSFLINIFLQLLSILIFIKSIIILLKFFQNIIVYIDNKNVIDWIENFYFYNNFFSVVYKTNLKIFKIICKIEDKKFKRTVFFIWKEFILLFIFKIFLSFFKIKEFILNNDFSHIIINRIEIMLILSLFMFIFGKHPIILFLFSFMAILMYFLFSKYISKWFNIEDEQFSHPNFLDILKFRERNSIFFNFLVKKKGENNYKVYNDIKYLDNNILRFNRIYNKIKKK